MRIGAEIAVVAVGGAIGSLTRWGIAELVSTRFAATLAVNVLGCLLIGVVAARRPRDDLMWLGVVTGGLGGFTTFSTFAVELRSLLAEARPAAAGVYLVATLLGAVAATHLARGTAR